MNVFALMDLVQIGMLVSVGYFATGSWAFSHWSMPPSSS